MRVARLAGVSFGHAPVAPMVRAVLFGAGAGGGARKDTLLFRRAYEIVCDFEPARRRGLRERRS